MAEKEKEERSQTSQDKKYSPIQHKPCQICEGKATGYHFGVISCEACKSFFRRSLKRKKEPICEKDGQCPLVASEVVGIPCPACRLRRCVRRGMSENAVKKGRYSLDRRAEAIQESRQYWSPPIQQQNPATNNNGNLSSPPIQDGRRSTSTGGSGHDTGSGPSSTGSGPQSTGSGPPSASLSSTANSLSADDFFSLLSEVCGDDMAKGPSVNNPLSTINDISLSTLLNDPTLSTETAPHNIQNLSDSGSSTGLQGQFTFRMEPTQIEPLTAINPTLLQRAEIKKEFQSQGSCSGFELPKPSLNGLPPPTLHEPGPPNSSLRHTTTAPPGGYNAAASSRIPSESSVARVPSVELVEPPQTATSKHQSPEDMDILCKLLMSDFKVKDDQDYIIDEIVAAFDKQNFTNKGFLAKVSDQQHKYLEGQKEEERMFGPIAKLSSQEFIQMYKETGVDIDGRLAIMQQHADVMDGWVRQVMQFYKGIPGFTDLPLKDQMSLIKGTKFEFSTATYFANWDVKRRVHASSVFKGIVISAEVILSYFLTDLSDQMEIYIGITERLQNLQITDREYTMMTALFVIDPDECVTEKGKEQCKQLAGKLDDAFRHLLKKRLSYDKTDEIMKNIKEIREMLRPISLKYNVEYFSSMKMYSEHCGVKYGELTWQYYDM